MMHLGMIHICTIEVLEYMSEYAYGMLVQILYHSTPTLSALKFERVS